jgi:hypothetical protein
LIRAPLPHALPWNTSFCKSHSLALANRGED